MRCSIAAAAIALGLSLGGEPSAFSSEGADALHAMVRPQAGESRWMEIDWHPNVWEARRIAAEQGKPILLWAGSGGAPAAGC